MFEQLPASPYDLAEDTSADDSGFWVEDVNHYCVKVYNEDAVEVFCSPTYTSDDAQANYADAWEQATEFLKEHEPADQVWTPETVLRGYHSIPHCAVSDADDRADEFHHHHKARWPQRN